MSQQEIPVAPARHGRQAISQNGRLDGLGRCRGASRDTRAEVVTRGHPASSPSSSALPTPSREGCRAPMKVPGRPARATATSTPSSARVRLVDRATDQGVDQGEDQGPLRVRCPRRQARFALTAKRPSPHDRRDPCAPLRARSPGPGAGRPRRPSPAAFCPTRRLLLCSGLAVALAVRATGLLDDAPASAKQSTTSPTLGLTCRSRTAHPSARVRPAATSSAAVVPWMPSAVATFPPFVRTMMASAVGVTAETMSAQPSG